jgi:hypothetical protein
MCLIQILSLVPTILTQSLRGFSPSFLSNARLVYFYFLPLHLQFSLTERNIVQTLLSLVSWSGVGLSPLGTSPTVAQVPDDEWWWVWYSRWNDWHGKPNYSDKTCLSATLSTTNPTWPNAGSNPSRRLTAWAMARPLVRAVTLYYLT